MAEKPAVAPAAALPAEPPAASNCVVKREEKAEGKAAENGSCVQVTVNGNTTTVVNSGCIQKPAKEKAAKAKPSPAGEQHGGKVPSGPSKSGDDGTCGTPVLDVFSVVLPEGMGRACDVAHALVDAFPQIATVRAVSDTRMLITLNVDDGKCDDRATKCCDSQQIPSVLRKAIQAKANELTVPVEPKVKTIIQKLYYLHDPSAVATIISSAYPNLRVHALPPDSVVLTADVNQDAGLEEERQAGEKEDALRAAERAIAQLDRPHSQISIDAWALQLATSKPDDLQKKIPELEALVGEYDAAMNRSVEAGWTDLASVISKPGSLDPLLLQYLTATTRVDSSGAVSLWRYPNQSAKYANAGYGLGYTSLYYPLTTNLIDMLVTLTSVNQPTVTASEMIDAMEGISRDSTGNAGREAKAHDPGVPCMSRDKALYQDPASHPSSATGRFAMECVYDELVGGLYARNDTPQSTSALGQMRASLADFLFNYKLMEEYPHDFHPYLEPIAADTLDASFGPVVAAFDEDLQVFQAQLQQDIIESLKDAHGLTYGYGGLVSLKVLGNQKGVVTTDVQNYFEAAQPATLNDLINNVQTEGASTSSTPLSSLVTSLAPAKAVELATAIGETLTPKPSAAHLGRGLDMTVTAHPLSGAYGAELDIEVKATENGAGIIQSGSATKSDDLNSRVSQHNVNTHVRVDSLKLFTISTLSSVLARSQKPWKPFDPVFEVPGLGLLVQKPRKPQQVYTQSLVFVDALIVPTAADLGNGVPMVFDLHETGANEFEILYSLDKLAPQHALGERILQYHQGIVDCLNREYIGSDNLVHEYRDGAPREACDPDDERFKDIGNAAAVRE